MVTQLLLALVLTGITVMIHAAGTVRVVLPLSGIWRTNAESWKTPAAIIPLVRLVSGLLLLHLQPLPDNDQANLHRPGKMRKIAKSLDGPVSG